MCSVFAWLMRPQATATMTPKDEVKRCVQYRMRRHHGDRVKPVARPREAR